MQNGEGVTLVSVGDQEFPVSPKVRLEVSDGEEVEAGQLIASSPVEEVCSKTFFEMLKARYEDLLVGEIAEEEIDSLKFLVTSVEGEEVPLEVGQELTQLDKAAYERLYP